MKKRGRLSTASPFKFLNKNKKGVFMKKKLSILILSTGVAFCLACYLFFKNRTKKMLQKEADEAIAAGDNAGI